MLLLHYGETALCKGDGEGEEGDWVRKAVGEWLKAKKE